MARSNLTTIIQRVSAIAEQIHALPEDERNYLLDLLLPEVETKPKVKRKRGKGSKSTRATSLAQKIQGTSNARCVHQVDDNGGEMDCGELASNAIHDPKGGYAGYHEFENGAPQGKSVAG